MNPTGDDAGRGGGLLRSTFNGADDIDDRGAPSATTSSISDDVESGDDDSPESRLSGGRRGSIGGIRCGAAHTTHPHGVIDLSFSVASEIGGVGYTVVRW